MVPERAFLQLQDAMSTFVTIDCVHDIQDVKGSSVKSANFQSRVTFLEKISDFFPFQFWKADINLSKRFLIFDRILIFQRVLDFFVKSGFFDTESTRDVAFP